MAYKIYYYLLRSIMKNIGIKLKEKREQNGLSIEEVAEDLKLIDADLLRRSGQFAEVIKRYSDADKCASKQIVVDGLRFEVEKAKEEDMNRYKFAGDGKFETV